MDPRQNNRHPRRQRQAQSSNNGHQRFSWQSPPSTPPEEPTGDFSQPQQQSSAQLNTNVSSHGRAFSYAQTPIEHRAPNYSTSNEPSLPRSPSTPIDPHPQSIHRPHNITTQPQSQPPAYTYPQENALLSPLSPHDSSRAALISPVSPVAQLPQIQTNTKHARQLSSLSPINTSVGQYNTPPVPPTPHSHKNEVSPLPLKSPITPISAGPIKKDSSEHPLPMSPNRKSYAAEPYSPHGFTTNPMRAVFSPDSAHGPNGLDYALHQPGQITHPNMDLSPKGASREWKHSLCSCSGDISTCLTGLFCPCILYGRTSYRLNQKSSKKDPTDMLGYKSTNGHCLVMGVSCGFWWLYPMIQRTRLRHLYKLSGSFGGDLVKSCCCCCCIAIQNEREVKDREENARRWAGPASTEVYISSDQMVYTPQR